MFMNDEILKDSNLVCAYARADKIINSDDGSYEMMMQARAFLMEIYSKLEKIVETAGKRSPSVWHGQLLKTIIHYQQGCLSTVLTDLPNAENELKVALTNIPSDIDDKCSILVKVSVYNELARLCCQRKQFEEAEQFYMKAKYSVQEFFISQTEAYSLQDLFTPGLSQIKPSGTTQLKELQQEAEQFLEMRGGSKRLDYEANIHHKDFVKCLERKHYNQKMSESCYFLVSFFAERKNFEHARKYLSLADGVIQAKNDKVSKEERERLFIFSKLIYSLCLMKASADKLQERKRVMIGTRKFENLENFQFCQSQRNTVIQYERNYITLPAKDWSEAKTVFNFGKKFTDFALQLFSSNEDQSKALDVWQILSKMYKNLAPFQKEKIASNDALARLSKIQWRRVKSLEPFLKVLTADQDSVKIQELTFELSEVYMELLELKQKKFERTAGNLDPKLLQKMAYYCFSGIRICEKFLDTLSFHGGPPQYSDEMVKPAMVVTFRIGKFYNKIFTPIGTDQVRFTEIAIDWYKKVVDYCRDHPSQARTVEMELNHSLSTIDLLQRQLKIHAKSSAGADSQ